MQKQKLRLDELKVESFITSDGKALKTINGMGETVNICTTDYQTTYDPTNTRCGSPCARVSGNLRCVTAFAEPDPNGTGSAGSIVNPPVPPYPGSLACSNDCVTIGQVGCDSVVGQFTCP